MKKVIRDGKVAVLYSPGYGGGWYSWNKDIPECLFHPEIVALVEADKRNEITDELCKKLFDVTYFFNGGSEQLEIEWVPQGSEIYIDEYDGFESLTFNSDLKHIIA